METHTISTSPARASGNGSTTPATEIGLLPTWVSSGVSVSHSGAVTIFGVLQDVRTETRQMTEAWLRLAHKLVDRVDGFATSALNAAERATRAPLEVLQ